MMIIYDDHIMVIYERPQPSCCSWRSRFFLKIYLFSEKLIFRVCLKCNFKAVCKKSLKTYQKYYRETKWTSPSNFWWKIIYNHYGIIKNPLLRGPFVRWWDLLPGGPPPGIVKSEAPLTTQYSQTDYLTRLLTPKGSADLPRHYMPPLRFLKEFLADIIP